MEAVTLTPYSENELKTLVYVAVKAALDEREDPQKHPQPFIKGIHGLAKFLQVSPAKAQRLKNEGIFPYWQEGRVLLFDPDKIREVMSKRERR